MSPVGPSQGRRRLYRQVAQGESQLASVRRGDCLCVSSAFEGTALRCSALPRTQSLQQYARVIDARIAGLIKLGRVRRVCTASRPISRPRHQADEVMFSTLASPPLFPSAPTLFASGVRPSAPGACSARAGARGQRHHGSLPLPPSMLTPARPARWPCARPRAPETLPRAAPPRAKTLYSSIGRPGGGQYSRVGSVGSTTHASRPMRT